MIKFVVLLAMFSLTSHAGEEVDGAADSIVKVGYVNCGKPYNQYQNGQLSGGLVYEVARKITERANFSPAFLELPPLRVTEFLKRGEVQMVCFYNAKWTPEPEAFLWGPPLATYREFFIVRAGDALNDHAQLRGKTIATHQGYFYSDQLMTFFKSGVARRVEHTDTAHLYQLLALNRVDAIVDNEFSFHAMVDKTAGVSFKMTPLKDYEYPVTCALSKTNETVSGSLLEAMNELARSGTMNQLVATYLR